MEDKAFVDNLVAKAVSQQLNRILTTHLSTKYNHLIETQIDMEPRNEAFWFFGGYEAPYELRRKRRGGWAKEWENAPIDQCLHYTANPIFQLRHNLPLKEIISLQESENSSFEIPVEDRDPRQFEYFYERRRAAIIPGFWPGDHSEFGFISFHNRGHLQNRPKNFNDEEDAIKSQAVFGSFSWLYGQACYQGEDYKFFRMVFLLIVYITLVNIFLSTFSLIFN